MKFNWGTGIVLAFIGFISFILYFVINMNTQKAYNHDLVTNDYYAEELAYQDKIDKLKNASLLKENISVEKTTSGLKVIFPKNFNTEEIKGKVFLYRPSNKQLDFEMLISLSSRILLIPDNRLLGGRWNLTVDWEYQDAEYLYKKEMFY